MRILLVSLILGASLGFSSALAQDCNNPTNQTDMTQCAVKAFQKSDAELNATYKQVEARLRDDPDTKKLLITAQRAWVAFRDAECTFASSGTEGGSAHPMMEAQCREAVTRKRVDGLKVYLNCEEGDLSCPLPPQ